MAAAAVLALATAALLLEFLWTGGKITSDSLGQTLRDNVGWIAFWGLVWFLTRKEQAEGHRRGPDRKPLQARQSIITLFAASLLLLPMVILFALAGRLGGLEAFIPAALLAIAWAVLVRELDRTLWLTSEGIAHLSPWTGRARIVRWNEVEAVVERRGFTGEAFALLCTDHRVLHVPQRSEAIGEFAAMCLAWLEPSAVHAHHAARRRLELLARSRSAV